MLKEPSRRMKTTWQDAVDRDLKMMQPERKMADDRTQWQGTIDDNCGDPR